MSFKAALVQMRSGRDVARNLADAAAMVREAKAGGAAFVVTPENTNIIDLDKARVDALAQSEASDAGVAAFSSLARELKLWLLIGSLVLRGDGGKRVNRSLLFAPDGAVAARYDKIHLFDVDLPSGERYRESDAISPGNKAVVADLPWCRLGLTICYDVRFAALYRTLAKAGASLITAPAAFTVPTGQAHWHVLLRARAIETGSFVLAAAQGGVHDCDRATYGHSLAISPWGEILAEAGEDPGVIYADIDPAQATLARQRIPALRHDRAFSPPELKPLETIATSAA